MNINLIMIGKTRNNWLLEGIGDYKSRLRHYCNFREILVPDIRNSKSLSEDEQKRKEGLKIAEFIPKGSLTVLLDETGKEMDSAGFASYIEKRGITAKEISFIIGGPYGFSMELKNLAADKLSLSRMTFSHQMVRLIFVEQLYRAFTIIRGEPYHHS